MSVAIQLLIWKTMKRRPVRARDWLWRCLINQQWKYSLSLFYSPLQLSTTTMAYSTSIWQLWEKSWSVMEQLCVCVCVSFWQSVLSYGHAHLVCRRVSLSSSWSPTVARSQHQSLRLLWATAIRFLAVYGAELRQSEQGYPSESFPRSCVLLTELILSLIILSKSSPH